MVKKYQLKQNEIKRNKKFMMNIDRAESAEKERIEWKLKKKMIWKTQKMLR